MTNEAAIGCLSVRQRVLEAKLLLNREYDFALCGLSWEARCTTAINNLVDVPKRAVFIRFESRDVRIDAIKDVAYAALRTLFKETQVLLLQRAVSTRENTALLEGWLQEEYVKVQRPLRILLDVTCIPKSYILFLLARLIHPPGAP